jgi:hygromycin-B 4-O-kinase
LTAPIDVSQAYSFLVSHFSTEPEDIAQIGEGAWSRAFGFRLGDEALVIRFGHHPADFRKDQLAAAYNTQGLPIPQVLEVGPAWDRYFAISRRAWGVPLESLDSAAWRAVVPSVVAALEALRTADISATAGWGGWGADGRGEAASWSRHLLAVGDLASHERIQGWRGRLLASPAGPVGDAAFAWGLERLEAVASDATPRGLLHCDLINRNVLVHEGRVSASFDWGCSRYGDHLYDLAWFEFWAPWMPQLDIAHLKTELEQKWRAVGYAPQDKQARLAACYLHIGLDHIAYNAHLGDWTTLLDVVARMRALAAEE